MGCLQPHHHQSYVIRYTLFACIHFYTCITFKRGPYNPKIVSLTIIHLSYLSVFTRCIFLPVHTKPCLSSSNTSWNNAQALIAILRWCAVKKPFKQTNKQASKRVIINYRLWSLIWANIIDTVQRVSPILSIGLSIIFTSACSLTLIFTSVCSLTLKLTN